MFILFWQTKRKKNKISCLASHRLFFFFFFALPHFILFFCLSPWANKVLITFSMPFIVDNTSSCRPFHCSICKQPQPSSF